MNDPLSRGTSLPEPHRGVAEKAKETAQNLGSQVKEKVQDWASSAASTAEHAWESTKAGASAVADKADRLIQHIADHRADHVADQRSLPFVGRDVRMPLRDRVPMSPNEGQLD